MLLAVNGTLMRGLALNGNLLQVGATFVREAQTAALYRLWSIHDIHPGMLRVNTGGAAIWLELWEVPDAGIIQIMSLEPPGLSIGRVTLDDGRDVLGVLAEPYLLAEQREITHFGGWRAYTASLSRLAPGGQAAAGPT